MILNVGCGEDQKGDLRLDKERTGAANILADAQYLPFKSRSFDFVFSISVLEHISDWLRALHELLRVTRKKLVFEVPVNSDIRITDPWRILFPSPRNIRLFLSIPRRARETLWQMDPEILRDVILFYGDYLSAQEKIFRIYAGVPSRSWRITAWRMDAYESDL